MLGVEVAREQLRKLEYQNEPQLTKPSGRGDAEDDGRAKMTKFNEEDMERIEGHASGILQNLQKLANIKTVAQERLEAQNHQKHQVASLFTGDKVMYLVVKFVAELRQKVRERKSRSISTRNEKLMEEYMKK